MESFNPSLSRLPVLHLSVQRVFPGFQSLIHEHLDPSPLHLAGTVSLLPLAFIFCFYIFQFFFASQFCCPHFLPSFCSVIPFTHFCTEFCGIVGGNESGFYTIHQNSFPLLFNPIAIALDHTLITYCWDN